MKELSTDKEAIARRRRRAESPEYYKTKAREDARKRRAKDPARWRNEVRAWYQKNLNKYLWSAAKKRAKDKGLDFDIQMEDVVIPETCPALGIKLYSSLGKGREVNRDHSPTIDRIDSTKGYTKDNIVVVSHKANYIKYTATVEEIFKVAEFYKDLHEKTRTQTPTS